MPKLIPILFSLWMLIANSCAMKNFVVYGFSTDQSRTTLSHYSINNHLTTENTASDNTCKTYVKEGNVKDALLLKKQNDFTLYFADEFTDFIPRLFSEIKVRGPNTSMPLVDQSTLYLYYQKFQFYA